MVVSLKSAEEGPKPKREKIIERFFVKDRPLGGVEGGDSWTRELDEGRWARELDEGSWILELVLPIVLEMEAADKDGTYIPTVAL